MGAICTQRAPPKLKALATKLVCEIFVARMNDTLLFRRICDILGKNYTRLLLGLLAPLGLASDKEGRQQTH